MLWHVPAARGSRELPKCSCGSGNQLYVEIPTSRGMHTLQLTERDSRSCIKELSARASDFSDFQTFDELLMVTATGFQVTYLEFSFFSGQIRYIYPEKP